MSNQVPHSHAEHHEHVAPEPAAHNARRARRLWFTLVLNLGIVVAQVIIGFIAHSLGLLADAGHNLTDVIAIVTSLVAVQMALRLPTDKRSYGYHRATILAAVVNAASILAITVLITYEGVRRIINPPEVHGGLIVIVALAAAALNGFSVLVLRESHDGHDHPANGGGKDLNMHSVLLHMLGDTLASIGVAVAGAIILITGRYNWLDPAVSIGIGLLIAVQAFRLLRQALDVLLESTPSDIDLDQLTVAIQETAGVASVHDLHVWSLSSDLRALSAHLLLEDAPSVKDSQAIGDNVKAMLSRQFGISHATLEVESEACDDDTTAACAVYVPTISKRVKR